jgi:hypothetical protein
MDNYFSSPDLYSNLTKQKINCCGTVQPNCKGVPNDFRSKKWKLKCSDMTAVVSMDKCDMHMLTNIHDPPAEGNFCDDNGNALKPEIVEHYN